MRALRCTSAELVLPSEKEGLASVTLGLVSAVVAGVVAGAFPRVPRENLGATATTHPDAGVAAVGADLQFPPEPGGGGQRRGAEEERAERRGGLAGGGACLAQREVGQAAAAEAHLKGCAAVPVLGFWIGARLR